jgi:hypothetical protein
MSTISFFTPLNSLDSAQHTMTSSVAHLRKELLSLSVPAEIRDLMESTCARCEAALEDARTAVESLTDLIHYPEPGLRPEPRLDLIDARMGDVLDSILHAESESVRRSANQLGTARACVLLGKSRAEISKAQVEAASALAGIRERLDERAAAPAPLASHTFRCSKCSRVAGRVQLVADGDRVTLVRRCCTSEMGGGSALDAESIERWRTAISTANIREIHKYDEEVAAFYCPECDACYCGDHWKRWDVFDDDDGFCWHDSIRGRCPSGHERMMED